MPFAPSSPSAVSLVFPPDSPGLTSFPVPLERPHSSAATAGHPSEPSLLFICKVPLNQGLTEQRHCLKRAFGSFQSNGKKKNNQEEEGRTPDSRCRGRSRSKQAALLSREGLVLAERSLPTLEF